MVSPLVEYVVSLGLDGRVTSRGSVSVPVVDSALAEELVEAVRAIKDEEKKVDAEEPEKTAIQAAGKLIVAEEVAEGHVSWDACKYRLLSCIAPETDSIRKVKLFLGALGGSHALLFWIVFLGGLLLCDALMAATTWFMGYWAEQYGIHPPETVSIALYVDRSPFPLHAPHFIFSYLSVYGVMVLGALISYVAGYCVYIFGGLRASRSIHRQLIEAVLGTTLRCVPNDHIGFVMNHLFHFQMA